MTNPTPNHVEAIDALELADVLGGTDTNSLWEIKKSLDSRAKEQKESGDESIAHSLFTLGAACSMMLDSDSPNNSFKPYAQYGNRRSPALEDFNDKDISFFEKICEEIEACIFRARIADVLWLRKTENRFKFAKFAVEAYFKSPLNESLWREERLENWERGLQLGKQLGRGLKDQIDQATQELEGEFKRTGIGSAYYGIAIGRLFRKYSLLWSDEDLAFDHFRQLAECAKGDNDFQLGCDLFKESISFGFAKDGELVADVRLEAADCLRRIGENSHGLIAGTKFEEAVNLLRGIPVSLRSERNVDSQIEVLRKKIREAGGFTLEHMSHFQSPPIDLSELQTSARRIVQSETAIDSIRLLASVSMPPVKKALFDEAEQQLCQFPLKGLFQGIHYARDGRKNAVVPSSDGQPHEHAETVWETAINQLLASVRLISQGLIVPALFAVNGQHRVRIQDLLDLCSKSPNIPVDRHHFWARALHLGFEGDFMSALHVGIPQIEHLVRVFLNRAGSITATLDSQGIEAEIGLSALLEKSEAEAIFGEDLLFEMKGLLTDRYGPNLRNEIAHGLASVHDCLSLNAVYVWWLMLRIACAFPSEDGQPEEQSE